MWRLVLQLYTYLAIATGTATDNDFLVNNPKCAIPNWAPHNAETRDIFQRQEYQPCTLKPLLTYVQDGVLRVNKSAVKYYYDRNEPEQCMYRYIGRARSKVEPDVGFTMSPMMRFEGLLVPVRDTIYVQCINLAKDVVYENVHQIMWPIRLPEQSQQTKPISVLLVVIDSVSRLNFARTMPKTKQYILSKGFTEMLAYNKIGDNTFPNFNALLTGLSTEDSDKVCNSTVIGGLDNCPQIWYDYRRLGYATAYIEDWTSIGTFNYLKKGFLKPPTDHYYKPYFEASEYMLPKVIKDTMPYCTGPESASERVLNLAKDFSQLYKNKPSFGIFWMNTFSHNHINTPSGMDDKFVDFFKTLDDALNDSVVILLSDHGIRFGNILQTTVGWYEVRLPMHFISLPQWFKDEFTQESRNLEKNARKLTTTYDLHRTLQHFLVLSGKNYTMREDNGHPKGVSLLKPIPEERSCEDAGLSEKWCTCNYNRYVDNKLV